MYQPRRVTQAPQAVLPDADAASLAAFRSGPRRAARSRAASLGARLAPASLSVALVATAGAIILNPKPTEADALLAVPERTDQVSRSDADREAVPSRAVVEALASDEAQQTGTPAAAAPVAAAWSAQFGAVVGKQFAQSAATVRTQANGESATMATLATGDSVDATDVVVNGFRQVVVDKKSGWVAEDELDDTAPKPATAKPTATAAKATAAKAAAPTTYSGPSKLGLKPKAMVVYNAVMARYSVPSVGGYRASSLSSHQCGLAIDFMVYTNAGLGNGIADYLIANASAFGITHIIWRQRIWTPYNPSWRAMADRGGITANHYDHVHVALADHC